MMAPGPAIGQETASDPVESEAEEAEDAEESDAGPTEGVEEIEVVGDTTSVLGGEEQSSSTLFQADELEGIGVEDVSDISLFTPNLEIRTASATTATFFIRGVGLQDFSSNAAGAVAVYLDDVPMNTPPIQLLPVFDVEGISVLRGPQGIGPGRDASAGALRISSRKPAFESNSDFSFNLGSVVSDDAKNAFRQEYKGALEVPLVEDVFGARFAFVYRNNDPFFENGCGDALPEELRPPGPDGAVCGESVGGGFFQLPVVPAGLPKLVGDDNAWAARGIFRLVPPESDLDVMLIARGYRLDRDSTVGQAAGSKRSGPGPVASFVGGNVTTSRGVYVEPDGLAEQQRLSEAFQAQGIPTGPSNNAANEITTANFIDRLDEKPYRGDYNRVGNTSLDAWATTLDIRYDGDDAQFRSITSYDTWDRFVEADQDFTPEVLFETAGTKDESWQVAQELRVQGDLAEYPLAWDLGGSFLNESIDSSAELRRGTQNTVFPGIVRDYSQDLLSFLVWGGVTVDFWDDYFTLETGVRYNWVQKDFELSQFLLDSNGVQSTFGGGERSSRATWQEPTWMVGLTFRPHERFDLYWKYTHGFKSGQFNSNSPQADPAEPETIDAFEIGFSANAWDYRLRLGGALFHYDYQNYQVFNFESVPGQNPTLEIINAESAENYGAELEVVVNPLRGYVPQPVELLEVVLRGGWLETEFLDFTDEQTDTRDGVITPILADFSGNPLINAPNLNFSGSVSWALDLGRFGFLTPRYDFAWTDDVSFDPSGGKGQLDVDGNTVKPENTIGQPAYWLHNVRIALMSPDTRWEVSAFCRNVADQRYRNFAFDASRFGNDVINFVGDPRTCGAGATVRF